MDVTTLRELFRYLRAWHSLFESDGVDVLSGPDGRDYCLWDIEYLYEETQRLLPPRQQQAIRLCLYQGMREVDAALAMGVSPTNPVGMYSTAGLSKVCLLIEAGELERYQEAFA